MLGELIESICEPLRHQPRWDYDVKRVNALPFRTRKSLLQEISEPVGAPKLQWGNWLNTNVEGKTFGPREVEWKILGANLYADD